MKEKKKKKKKLKYEELMELIEAERRLAKISEKLDLDVGINYIEKRFEIYYESDEKLQQLLDKLKNL